MVGDGAEFISWKGLKGRRHASAGVRLHLALVSGQSPGVERRVVTVLYCTVLYCTVLYCTVLYCTVLYCTVLYCTRCWCRAPPPPGGWCRGCCPGRGAAPRPSPCPPTLCCCSVRLFHCSECNTQRKSLLKLSVCQKNLLRIVAGLVSTASCLHLVHCKKSEKAVVATFSNYCIYPRRPENSHSSDMFHPANGCIC